MLGVDIDIDIDIDFELPCAPLALSSSFYPPPLIISHTTASRSEYMFKVGGKTLDETSMDRLLPSNIPGDE